ncbi:trypsin-like serine protease [Corynebacterium hiratae]|uniref:Trypsin-like peptidase domain-containing protein n=1 Tax=Corynebacterium aurimucosum TaxID=169292 RepID=A0A6I3KBZ4_9CORY|nr:trypsin-like serine protease [Corynebacterium aurimucosum]MTD91517.1 trypsin-like peptidase domain-containing protein [Corynebacterium aurimucosum]
MPVLQSSDTNPVNDNRIASYFSVSPVSEQERRTCTASNIADNLWLVARHCSPKAGDRLRQYDGDEATVKRVHFMSDVDDLALVRVGSGIDAKAFDLPTSSVEKGDALTLIGYGANHEYSSIAKLKVEGFIESYPPEIGIPFHDLAIAVTTTPSRTCEGDSGSPAYTNNTIYATHTAAASNQECTNGKGNMTWLTVLNSKRVAWIKSVCRDEPAADSGRPSQATETSL